MTHAEARHLIGKTIRNIWNARQCLHRGAAKVERIDDGGCIYLTTQEGRTVTYFAKVIKSWEVCA